MSVRFEARIRRGCALCAAGILACLGALARPLVAQDPLTWEQVRDRLARNNPTLAASRTGIEENRANEITAGLRPNPVLSFVADQFRIFNPIRFSRFRTRRSPRISASFSSGVNKRELRVESAELAPSISRTDPADLERQLTFKLRDAFNRTLQAKSVLEVANDNLGYYDQVIKVNQQRFQAGDISRADMDRVELQRVQFESDIVSAQVNLRTAKIDLLALMNEHTPVETFEITGPFDFNENILLKDELHQAALDERPDLKSASTVIDKAHTDHKLAIANGSRDPDFGLEYQRTQSDNTVGIGVSIPIRIFDRNQGEKARTQLEIRRTEQARTGLTNTVLRDVDSAYEQLESVRKLLRPYRDGTCRRRRACGTRSRSLTSAAARRCWNFSMRRKHTAICN